MSFLDDAVNFEQENYDQGFSEGKVQGALDGEQEGLDAGFESGCAFGLHFGEIYGYCLYLKARLANDSQGLPESSASSLHSGRVSARALATLDQLLKMCEQLSLQNTDAASQQFEKIISKYKLLLAQTQSSDTAPSTAEAFSISY